LVDIPFEVSKEEVVDGILDLDIFSSIPYSRNAISIIKVIQKPNNDYYSLILEIPAKLFLPLLKIRRFSASWAYLTVEESKSARLCFNCGSHSHFKKDCNSKSV